MQITKISKQTRNTDRLNLFIDGEYFCSISTKTLINHGLHKGQNLSTTDLDNVKAAALSDLLLNDAYRYLSFRARSEKEMALYLKRRLYQKYKDFNVSDPEQKISETIEYLKTSNFIDDEAFAKNFVNTRTNSNKPESINSIKFKLMQKGISKETIDQHIKKLSLDENFEYENALAAIEKKLSSIKSKSKDTHDIRNKALRHLISKGFTYETSLQAVDTITNPS